MIVLRIVLGLFVLCVALFVIFWIGCLIIGYTINIHKEYEHFSDFYGKVFNAKYSFGIWLSGGRIKYYGMDKLPEGERFLFVSNHRSRYDTFVHAMALKRIAFISKPDNFKIPLGRRFMIRCLYMAIDRENARNAAKTIRHAADLISRGECSIGVYPEGTRNRVNDTLIEFRPGCFKIALWAKCPIVVGVTKGTDRLKYNFPGTTDIEFKIIKVLPYEEIKDLTTGEIAEIVRNLMLEELA